MRRFLSFLLAILVLVLAFAPCHDSVSAHVASHQTLLAPAHEHLPGGYDGADHCSPFCSCACCAAVTLPQAVFVEKELKDVYPAKPAAAYVTRKPQSVAQPVWQPPQLDV